VAKPKQLHLTNGNGELEEGAVMLLKSQINSIVKSIQKLLKNKNAKTRQGCFSLLTQLVNVLPGALSNYLPQIIPGINYSLKLAAFSFIRFYSNLKGWAYILGRNSFEYFFI
jgi:hypothetical protein